jgi:polysaccharide export outer membrane protein
VIGLKKYVWKIAVCLLALAGLCSCGAVNQNVMFRSEGEIIADSVLDIVSRAEKNYFIRSNDYLEIHVYTNKGERLVDPNQEMAKQLSDGGSGGGGQGGGGASVQETKVKYLVEDDGRVRLPLLGYLPVRGVSVHQLDSLLQVKYSEFYEDAFVMSKVVNHRVFILGNAGGKTEVVGKVIPLANENMSVIEIITLAGGMDYMAKSHKIRLLRGDLKNPNVYLIDLSTIEGVRKSQLNVQPNDIIYVERQRRIVSQILTEITPLLMMLNTALLLILTTRTLSK